MTAAAQPARTRRRRRLAAAVRALAAEEARPVGPMSRLAVLAAQLSRRGRRPAVPEQVLDGLRALAAEPGTQAADDADADAPDLLARMRHAPPMPAEIGVAIGAMLLPLLRLAEDKDATTP